MSAQAGRVSARANGHSRRRERSPSAPTISRAESTLAENKNEIRKLKLLMGDLPVLLITGPGRRPGHHPVGTGRDRSQ